MDPVIVIAIAVIASAIVAGVVVMFTRRGSATASGEVDTRLRQLEADLSALRDAKAAVERVLAVEEQKASRIPDLEAALVERSAVLDGMRDGKALAERELAAATEAVSQTRATLSTTLAKVTELEAQIRDAAARMETVRTEKSKLEEDLAARNEALRQAEVGILELRQRLESAENGRAEVQVRLDAMRDGKAALEQASAKLQETLDQEMKQSAEKLTLLQNAKEEMSRQFKLLAEEVMKSHGETFSKQNKEQLDGLLTPLRDKLTEFQQGLQTAQNESTKERATLAEQIRALTDTSARMSHETQNLTRALKGKAQTQGAWGEMILGTILERSGLRKGQEYEAQESHSAEDGSRLRPDVIINLPNSERIIVDAKVSLTAFEAYVNTADDGERATNLGRHLASLRSHIRTLAGKEYQVVTGNGLDFVIMFVPIEGALAVALQEDPALTAFAAECHVAIATPTTLMMALRTVASLWQVERRNQNAEQIAERAGKIYDKFVGFIGDMNTLGNRLGQARECYEEAVSKLSTGRGNLVRQVEQLKNMGAKTAKSLPASLTGEEKPVALPAPEVVDA